MDAHGATFQDAIRELEQISTLISRVESKIEAMNKKLCKDLPSATMASTQHPVQLYRNPVHFDVAAGVTTPYSDTSNPRKRRHALESWASGSSLSQQARRPKPPPCHLFDLPQEMLDCIYDFCKHDSRSKTRAIRIDYSGSTVAVVRHAPWLPLIQCNRRLARDYRESFWKFTTLELIDYFDACKALSPPPLHPTLLQNLTRLDTVILAVCELCEYDMHHNQRCGVYEELVSHRAWLGELTANMPSLKALSIKLYVQWPREPHTRILRHPKSPHQTFDLANSLNMLMELPAFQSLEVHRYHAMQAEHGLDARKPQAEVFDLYIKIISGRDDWGWVKEGGEEHRRMEREWWRERQWKGVEPWKEESDTMPRRAVE